MGYANSPCERCRTLIRKCSLTPPRHTTKGSENKDSAERKWKMKGWKTLVSSRSSESGAILKELETTSNSGNKKRDRKKSDGVQDEERERARVKRVKVPGSESGSSKAPKTVMTPRYVLLVVRPDSTRFSLYFYLCGANALFVIMDPFLPFIWRPPEHSKMGY